MEENFTVWQTDREGKKRLKYFNLKYFFYEYTCPFRIRGFSNGYKLFIKLYILNKYLMAYGTNKTVQYSA